MELVLLSLDAYGYYSEAEYHEEIWLSRETYEKVKQDIPSEICVGELDGKHSEVYGDVDVDIYSKKNVISKSNPNDLKSDGESLWYKLEKVLDEHGISIIKEQGDIALYIDSLDYNIEYSVSIPKSLKSDVEVAINNLLYMYENGVI